MAFIPFRLTLIIIYNVILLAFFISTCDCTIPSDPHGQHHVMHRNHGGFAWRLYDEKFRHIRALTPALAWHITKWDLAMEALHTVASSGRQAESQPSPFRTMQSPRKSSSGVCYTYNRVGKCERTTCPYAHVCANCGRKGHARRTCRSGQTIRSRSGNTNPGLQPQAWSLSDGICAFTAGWFGPMLYIWL